jgi:hypothetical protein
MRSCAPLRSHNRHINGPCTLLPPSKVSQIQTTINPKMLSREEPSRTNFTSFTSTRGRGGGRLRPDYGNRFYFQGSRGRGGSSANRPAPNSPTEPDLKEGLDLTKIIATVPAPARPAAPDDFPIENVKYVASYNWIQGEKPTIIAPGAARRFSSLVFEFISAIRFASHMDWARRPIHAAA